MGNSYGSSTTFSPNKGNSAASGIANGFGNSTSTQVGGTSALAGGAIAPEINFGNGFGDFAASGGGSSAFGSPLLIPGTGTPFIPAVPGTAGSNNKKNKGGEDIAATEGTPAVAATAPDFVNPLQTGGGGGGFGFTFGGGIGNVSGDAGKSSASGNSQANGSGSAVGNSGVFGAAGGSGGGSTNGNGGGNAAFSSLGVNGITAFNGTGGGTASGGGGSYVGFFPPTPVILGAFAPIAGP
jgi:hypothetical protein